MDVSTDKLLKILLMHESFARFAHHSKILVQSTLSYLTTFSYLATFFITRK